MPARGLEPAYEVEVRSAEDGTLVTAAGELDAAAAPVFRGALAEAVSGTRPVLVDLSRVTFLDACALRVLVEAAMSARDKGRNIVLVDPAPVTVRLLEITGLFGIFAPASESPGMARVSPTRPEGSPSPTFRSPQGWRSPAFLPAPLPGL